MFSSCGIVCFVIGRVVPDIVKEHRAFRMSETAHLVTQHYIPDDTTRLCDPDYLKNVTEEC